MKCFVYSGPCMHDSNFRQKRNHGKHSVNLLIFLFRFNFICSTNRIVFKVSKFQNEFMKSSFPKIWTKNCKDFCPVVVHYWGTYRAEIPRAIERGLQWIFYKTEMKIWAVGCGLGWTVLKKGLGRLWATFLACFFTFSGSKKFLKFFWKHHSVRTEKLHRKKVKKNFFGGGNFFFLEKPGFFRAKYKTVIRRGPNAILSLLLSALNYVWRFVLQPLNEKKSHIYADVCQNFFFLLFLLLSVMAHSPLMVTTSLIAFKIVATYVPN